MFFCGNDGLVKTENINPSENVPPDKRVKLSDGSSQDNNAYEGLFSPPRSIQTGGLSTGKETAGADLRRDLEVLAFLEEKVKRERDKVNDHLYHKACTSGRKDYFTISDEAHQFVNEILSQELKHCFEYPRYYFKEKTFPLLASAGQMEGDIQLNFSEVVLRLGCPSPLLVPSDTNNCVLNVKHETLCRKFLSSETGDDKMHPSKKHISRDDIAHKLAATYEADVVISVSSLKTLVDILPMLEHDWEIPVIISEDSEGTSGSPYKCVFVDKRIPPPSLSVRTKNELFFNHVLKCKFIHTYLQKYKSACPAPVIPDDIKPVPEEEQADLPRKMCDFKSFDDIFEVSEEVCELDTFGVPSGKKLQPSYKSMEDLELDSGESECDSLDEHVDQHLALCVKEYIMKTCKPLQEPIDLSKKSSVVSGNMEGHNVRDDFAQCLSPMSSADVEPEQLVMDSDGEKSAFSVSLASERKVSSNEVSENVTIASSKNCGHGRSEHISSLQDEDEDDDIGKKRYKDPMDETARDCPPLSQAENVRYSLLHLGQMKILMRSEIDAVCGCDHDDDEIDTQIEIDKCPKTPVFLFPKLEYQLTYGFEVTTPSELMREWVFLNTHPGSHVVRVRINTVESTLALWEIVCLPDLPENKDFDPRQADCQLHMILHTLKSGAFDLHSAIKQRLEEIDNFSDIDTSRNEVPWLPIDSSIALPEYKRDLIIPGCFYPIDFKGKQNQQKSNKET